MGASQSSLSAKALPLRVDLRMQSCFPYLLTEDQGDEVSCVSHAFGMAFYCALKRQKATDFSSYPATSKIYENAMREGGQTLKGTSFQAVQKQFQTLYFSVLKHNRLAFYSLQNKARDVKRVLAGGFAVVVGYQVNSTIGRFHKEIAASKRHGYLLPSFSRDPVAISGHTVLLIGYDDAVSAFIARNSWGRDWGFDGHFLILYRDIEDSSFFTDLVAIGSNDS